MHLFLKPLPASSHSKEGWSTVKKLLLLMKMITVIMLVGALQLSARTYSQKVTLSERGASLEQVFRSIKAQTGYVFFYDQALLRQARPVTIRVKDAPLAEALDLCFSNQPLDYSIVGTTIVVKEKTATSSSVASVAIASATATIDISGRVTDADGNPLVGANVKVKGTDYGTTTNSDGVFILKGVDENAILEISFVGYETNTVAVATKTSIVVSLKVKPESLNEVVINKGYYTEKQRFSVGNVAKVTAKDIEKQPVNNPLLALQGRVTGMEIIQSSGVPGSAVKVQIRGRNSIFNGNEPLYIIDGVPYNSQLMPGLGEILGGSGSLNGQSIYGNPLSFIDPSSIESIEVLKDADATAIYGSRAANGAVLITTKKGNVGETKVDINAYTGLGRITRKISLLNLRQYLDMRYEAYKNDGVLVTTLTPDNSNFDLTVWDTTRHTDWQEELIGETARYSNIQGSISGGTTAVQYFLGGRYQKESTVFPGDFFNKKGSVNFNLSANSANKKLRLLLSASYMANRNQLLDADISSRITLAPNAPPLYGSDGYLNWAPHGSIAATWDNPLANQLRTYRNTTYNLVSNAVIGYEILPNLSLRSSFGFANMSTDETKINPSSSQNPNNNIIESISKFANTSIRNWIIEPQVTYSKNLGKSNLETLFGGTFQSNMQEATLLNGSGFSSDQLLTNIKAASIINVTFDNNILYRYTAAFGRIKYHWDNKYLLNVTFRRDGSSRFGSSRRFNNFGAVGIAWIFSNEKFFEKHLPFINYGKVRASYGTTGNDQVGDYRYLSLYYPTGFSYQGTLGLVINNLFNPELEWEQTKKLEIGLELGIVKDRINVSASYFRNRSANQLLGYQIPTATGFTSIDANQDTKVQNVGWEFQLSTNNLSSKKLEWRSTFNLTSYRNKLLEIGPESYGILHEWVGHSLNSNYLYRFYGVDPLTGQYLFFDKKGNPASIPDTSVFTDDLNPDFFGGFANTLRYKGFNLDILFQFVKQLGKTNFFGPYLPGGFSGGSNQPTTVLDRWQSPGDIKQIQRFNQNNSLFNSFGYANQSDAAYGDASFIRLKNVALSYQLPQEFLRRINIKGCRFFIQCQNLLTITKYKGGDPETRSISSLPPLKVVTTGIQVSL